MIYPIIIENKLNKHQQFIMIKEKSKEKII